MHWSYIANTLFQQHKRRLYTWTSPDGQCWNQIDYIFCSQRWRISIQSNRVLLYTAKTSSGVDCDLNHELLFAKFRLKLKKVGRTTGPFRYDLNQIPYNYTNTTLIHKYDTSIVDKEIENKGVTGVECRRSWKVPVNIWNMQNRRKIISFRVWNNFI